MKEDSSILEDVRAFVLGDRENSEFDDEIVVHINLALVTLNQNGIGNNIVVKDTTSKWEDFKNPLQPIGNLSFHMIPGYVNLSTKIIFDPPPPSNAEYYSKVIGELLWRLRTMYEGS